MRSAMPLLGRGLHKIRAAGFDLLFPPRCGVCAVDLAGGAEALVCEPCRNGLELVEGPVCPRCAARVPVAGDVQLDCNECRGVKLRFERTLALGRYEGLLRDWVRRMKADRRGLATRMLGELAWRRLGDALQSLQVDVATAVPMNPWRRWRRGIDPPRELAEIIARKLGVPAAGGMLRQLRNIPPQLGLSRSARFLNVAGEMRVRRGYHLAAAHVLLVDDILTTGATASEAARALKKAGACQVSVFVLARTPGGT